MSSGRGLRVASLCSQGKERVDLGEKSPDVVSKREKMRQRNGGQGTQEQDSRSDRSLYAWKLQRNHLTGTAAP